MKNFVAFITVFMLCLSFTVPAFAEESETTVDGSLPRVMLSSYSIEGDSISLIKKKEIEIVIKNYSSKSNIQY